MKLILITLVLRVLIGLTVCGVFARAIADDSLPSLFSIDVGSDSSSQNDGSNNSYHIMADFAFIQNSRLSFGLGDDLSNYDKRSVETDNYYIALLSDPSDFVSVGLEYGYWGNDNALEGDTWRVDLSLNTDNWNFTLSPSTTAYSLSTLLPRRPIIDFDGDAISTSAAYYGLEDWYLDISFIKYNYSAGLDNVDRDARTIFIIEKFLLANDALNLLYTLDDKSIIAGFGFSGDDYQLGIDWAQSTAAIDQLITTTISINAEKDISPGWVMALTLGNQSSALTDSFLFYSAGLRYHF